jgi:hypothetical protein
MIRSRSAAQTKARAEARAKAVAEAEAKVAAAEAESSSSGSGSETERETPRVTVARPKGEAAEERRARKAAVKAERSVSAASRRGTCLGFPFVSRSDPSIRSADQPGMWFHAGQSRGYPLVGVAPLDCAFTSRKSFAPRPFPTVSTRSRLSTLLHAITQPRIPQSAMRTRLDPTPILITFTSPISPTCRAFLRACRAYA